jgi:hypothetical protein
MMPVLKVMPGGFASRLASATGGGSRSCRRAPSRHQEWGALKRKGATRCEILTTG